MGKKLKNAKQVPFTLTPRLREMLEEIMISKGYPTMTAVVQQAIIEMHGSIFKDYIVAKTTAPKPKVVEREARTNKEEDIIKKLKGLKINKGGTDYCLYFTYERKNRYVQEVPVDALSSDMVSKQYFPSKTKVEELQKEGKVNYDYSQKTPEENQKS